MKIFQNPSRMNILLLMTTIKTESMELYFGTKKSILKKPTPLQIYSKEMDKNLFKWLKDATDEFLSITLSNLTKRERDLFSQYIIRCSREILYNKITSFYNLIHPLKIQCMGAASLTLALKTILQHDHLNTNTINIIANWTRGQCTVSQIVAMESDLVKTEGWIPCKTVMERMPIHETESEFEENLLKTLVSPFMLFPDKQTYRGTKRHFDEI